MNYIMYLLDFYKIHLFYNLLTLSCILINLLINLFYSMDLSLMDILQFFSPELNYSGDLLCKDNGGNIRDFFS